MATISELDTFVQKFKQLWKGGRDAHLDVESKAGKAWVSIRLCLEEEPGPLHLPCKHPKTFSSSRENRRKRRQAAREEYSRVESATEKVAAVPDIIEEKADAADAVTENTEIDQEQQELHVAEKAEEEKLVPNCEAAEEASDEVEDTKSERDDCADIVETEETIVNGIQKAVDENKANQSDTESKPGPIRSFIETVFATAVIGKADAKQITNDHLNALLSIIKSKEHLTRNIVSVNFGSVQTYQLRCGEFEHLVQIMMDVNTANLWESSRSYLFHHLGRDTWDLRDGTEVNFKRIHQKA